MGVFKIVEIHIEFVENMKVSSRKCREIGSKFQRL